MSLRHSQPPDDPVLPPELRAVERELGRLGAPVARAEFRAALRARFLSGDFESTTEDVLEHWHTPPAREEFRLELRERFLAGAQSPSLESPSVRRRAWPSPRAFGRLGLLAAAALLLIVPFLPSARAAGWHVVDSQGVDTFTIDGEPVASDEPALLNERLSRPDCMLESGSRAVRFARDRELLLQVEPETRVRLSPFFALRGDGLLVNLEAGAVAVSLSSGFAERIVVETPHGRVEVRGRAVGVELLGGGLCICCLEGEAELVTADDQRHQVMSGTSLFLPPGGPPGVKTGGVAHPKPVGAARAAASEHLDD